MPTLSGPTLTGRGPQLTRAVGVVGIVVGVLAGCGAGSGGAPAPTGRTTVPDVPLVLVTTSMLGEIVSQLVGDAAAIEVLIPNGQDPHDYAASARDRERMSDAVLVVTNGLGLEEGLQDALTQAADEGAPLFVATDHLEVRRTSVDGAGDPHIWTDPLALAQMADDLAAELEGSLRVSLDDELTMLLAMLDDFDSEVRSIMSTIPAGGCVLVTGHDSLGYFADRYGCEVVGAIVPGLSSTAASSAHDIADLGGVIERTGVPAIFTERGTPTQVAEQIAADAGVRLVELPAFALPVAGGYGAFIVELATAIASGLSSSGIAE